MESSKVLPPQSAENYQLKNLSRDVAEHLVVCTKEVTKTEKSAKSVAAACQCASELHKIMKLNVDMYKMGMGK